MVRVRPRDFLKEYDPKKHIVMAKPKCYGRGFLGMNLVTKAQHPCNCLRLREVVLVYNPTEPVPESATSIPPAEA